MKDLVLVVVDESGIYHIYTDRKDIKFIIYDFIAKDELKDTVEDSLKQFIYSFEADSLSKIDQEIIKDILKTEVLKDVNCKLQITSGD